MNNPQEGHQENAGPAPQNNAGGEVVERPGNVDKIRDILFGSQMRDYDKKFARLEERLLQETADLREEVKRRLSALEAYIKGEVATLEDAQRMERNERCDSIRALAGELKESATTWEKKSAQVDEQNAKAHRDTRQQILEQAKNLNGEMEQGHSNLKSKLDRESNEIRAMLTDRLALADLFSELSMRLRNEFNMPGK
jgi:hypothetical protein